MEACNGYLSGSNFKNKTAIAIVPDFVLTSLALCGAGAPVRVHPILLFLSFEVFTINWTITFSWGVKLRRPNYFLMLFLEDFLENSGVNSDPDGSYLCARQSSFPLGTVF
jgi:hypothetical protein